MDSTKSKPNSPQQIIAARSAAWLALALFCGVSAATALTFFDQAHRTSLEKVEQLQLPISPAKESSPK